jgi:hypothetical protein
MEIIQVLGMFLSSLWLSVLERDYSLELGNSWISELWKSSEIEIGH